MAITVFVGEFPVRYRTLIVRRWTIVRLFSCGQKLFVFEQFFSMINRNAIDYQRFLVLALAVD